MYIKKIPVFLVLLGGLLFAQPSMAAVVGDTDVRSEADMQERSAAIYNYW